MNSISFKFRTATAVTLFSATPLLWAMNSTPMECPNNEKQTIAILAIGNSLTLHLPLPTIGWKGNWGMAATAESKDYVSQLSSKLSSATSCNTSASRLSFAIFERSFWQETTATARQNITSSAKRANVIVVQLSDNVSESDFSTYEFERHYASLIKDIAEAAPAATIACIGPWWAHQAKEDVVVRSCRAVSGIPVSISDLRTNPDNRATSSSQNPGVAAHPSDAGMIAISTRIIDALRAAKKIR